MNEKPMQGNSDWINEFNLDLVDEVGCDDPTCKWPSAFWLKTNCCGETIFSCQHHLITSQSTIMRLTRENKTLVCKMCSTPMKPGEWLSPPSKL